LSDDQKDIYGVKDSSLSCMASGGILYHSPSAETKAAAFPSLQRHALWFVPQNDGGWGGAPPFLFFHTFSTFEKS
jgi:hypothetical protein